MHCFCFLALTLSNIWCPCLKSLCIEARYKGTEGFFSAFLDWVWKVLLFKMVRLNRRKVTSDPKPHQPNSHFIVYMLTQSLNQRKKCEKWKRFSIEGLGVKFSPKSGCQVLLSKNIELQPRLLLHTWAKDISQQKHRCVLNCETQMPIKIWIFLDMGDFWKGAKNVFFWALIQPLSRAENVPNTVEMDKKKEFK